MNRLKALRKQANLSQKELGQKANVNYRMIQFYEQGGRDINLASGMTLYNLSKALNCSMEELLNLPDTDTKKL